MNRRSNRLLRFSRLLLLDPGGGAVDAGVDYEVRDLVEAKADTGTGR